MCPKVVQRKPVASSLVETDRERDCESRTAHIISSRNSRLRSWKHDVRKVRLTVLNKTPSLHDQISQHSLPPCSILPIISHPATPTQDHTNHPPTSLSRRHLSVRQPSLPHPCEFLHLLHHRDEPNPISFSLLPSHQTLHLPRLQHNKRRRLKLLAFPLGISDPEPLDVIVESVGPTGEGEQSGEGGSEIRREVLVLEREARGEGSMEGREGGEDGRGEDRLASRGGRREEAGDFDLC